MHLIGRMMKMMAHKGILADQDRIKIQAECLPKKDDFLQLPKEEMDRILFEREAKVPVKIDALDHQLSAPSKLKYQLFKRLPNQKVYAPIRSRATQICHEALPYILGIRKGFPNEKGFAIDLHAQPLKSL